MSSNSGPLAELFKSRGFIAGLVFVVLVVGMGVWIVFDPRASDGGGARAGGQQGTQESVELATESTAPESVSECGLDAGDQSIPTGPLPMKSVRVGQTVTAPVVEGVGPGVIEDGEVSHCFAHSPTGAVVAAVNFMRWFSAREKLPDVITALMVPGSDRDRLASQVEVGWDGSVSSPFAIMGYKVEVRSSDEVLVTVLTSKSVDVLQLVSWPLVMVWESGDWKVETPANDSWGEQAETSTDAFTAWVVR